MRKHANTGGRDTCGEAVAERWGNCLRVAFLSRPVLRNLCAEEIDTPGELIGPVDAVFDANPVVCKTVVLEDGKDGVVIIEPFADLAMAETLGVSFDAGFLLAEVFKGAFGEVAVACVHGDDARGDGFEEGNGVLPGENGIAGVVIDAEIRVLNTGDEIAENIHVLGEFRVIPKVILVVIFDDERDAAIPRAWEAGLDGGGGVLNAVFTGDLGPALPG